MERAQRFALEVLGLELKLEPPPNPNRTAFLAWDNDRVRIELIQLVEDAERGRRLGDAEGRLDHVAVEVDDVEAAVEELRCHGVEFTTEAPVAIHNIRTLWTRPQTQAAFCGRCSARRPDFCAPRTEKPATGGPGQSRVYKFCRERQGFSQGRVVIARRQH